MTSFRRATVGRIQEAASALRQYEADNQTAFGPIQRNHLAIQIARQPEGTRLEIPRDNTTRQAAALGRGLQQLQEEEHQQARVSEEFLKTIKIEINNALVDVRVDIRTLRAALSLPQHDMFHEGIYNGYQRPGLNDEDNIEDVDHNNDDQADAEQNN